MAITMDEQHWLVRTLLRPVRWVARQFLDIVPASVKRRWVPLMRFAFGFQISSEAVAFVRDRCGVGTSLLVFGLGRDSAAWTIVNAQGKTTFIENDPTWTAIVTEQHPDLDVHVVTYETQIEEALSYTDVAQIPLVDLPESVMAQSWDIVVVDGPMGWTTGNCPGRASSITQGRSLVATGGVALIDDSQRVVERFISDLVFERPADLVLSPQRPVGVFFV